ncbi:putative fatty acyl-CoA reductase CG5065 isoform X2 [Bombus pyrosoma]|uniref:putative fatty acyl-CoA reductase CG5065 isoform X2 n=1 Tax=Bombus pyrosoma TaxID=396416 RepID=UPI001CB97EB1|nr:putative fatty acyl-CoA reductase CG5065 isoform X2 [Bombus pyrosoma]XP_043595367.1 putative fatty acyl-CoA reductase CG5065 isoform X2 [Bombus pyrosoma]
MNNGMFRAEDRGSYNMGTMNTEINENEINKRLNKVNSIEEFYAGTGVLVTGATGFVGKGLLEKLMRVCPRVTVIFLLIRPKSNQTIEQRFKKLINDPIYDDVRAKYPSVLGRVQPVRGDVSLPNLGLSPEDRNLLLKKVNIVFHIAATVRFNEPLSAAVNMNTKGTARIIELCKELKHVISIVHVSTAYSNANLPQIEEKVYSTSLEPSTVINMCDKLDIELINMLEKKILETHPNTYTFTKNLAEQIVASDSKGLPVAIVRPSIIGASLEEPCPGWLENIFGVTNIFLQISKGSAKAIWGRKDARLDLVPVDFVVDTIMCAAWHVTLHHRDNEVKVYNCTSNAYPFKWGQMKDAIVKCSIETPLNGTLWYPGCPMVANRYIYNALHLILHVLPAFVIDIFLRFRGNKPIMMKIVKYCYQLVTVTAYFTMHEWTFQRDNITDMVKKVKMLKDGNVVKLDLQDMNWEKYIATYMMGIKKFILKEDLESMDAARQRLSKLYWIHQTTQISAISFLLWIILRVTY